MKLKKALVGLACLTTVFTLVACKGKTIKKATTSSKTTTNIISTTKKETTKKQTTAATTTKSQIPEKYAVTKEVFDSYFNPASFEASMAFNGTIDIVSTMEGYGENKFKTEIANKYYLETNESFPSSTFKVFYKDGDMAAVDTYTNEGSGWKVSKYSPEKYTDINLFCLINTYIPAGFDFDKCTFNYETNSYESNEEKSYTYNRGEYSYTNTISNLKVKFEDNKIVSISFKSKQCEYNSIGDQVGAYYMDGTLTFSKLGTTTVEPISAIS